MPVPLLLWAAGAASLGGLKKLADGASSFRDANSINERARLLSEATHQVIERRDRELLDAKTAFEQGRRTIEATSQVRFAQLFERQIKRLKLTDKEFALKFNVPESELARLHAVSAADLDMVRTLLSAGTAGAAVSKGVAGAVLTWGVASTGTAIGTLSGAAATNATLAALGGGSLAAGGGGMLMGTMVLGGLVTAPALIVTGYGVAKKGQQALTEAHKNEANVQEYRAKAKLRWVVQDGILRRMEELSAVQDGLVARLEVAIDVCEEQERLYDGAVREQDFDAAFRLAQAVSQIIQTPVHDDQGHLTSESEQEVKRHAPDSGEATATHGSTLKQDPNQPIQWDEPIEVVLIADDVIEAACFTGVGDDILGSAGKRLRIWSFSDEGIDEEEISDEPMRAYRFASSPERSLLVAARGRDPVLVFEDIYGDAPDVIEVDGEGEAAIGVALVAAKGHLCVAYVSGRVTAFDLTSGDEVWEHTFDVGRCRTLAGDPQGQWLALGQEDGYISLIRYGEDKAQRRGRYGHFCNDLAFSPDGHLLLSASEDRTARLWSVEERRELHQFTWQNRYADRVAFSPDGSLLAVAFANGTVGIWESESGALVNLFSAGSGRATAIQFNPDGDLLLLAGDDGLRLCFPHTAT
ncbi:hypothetical protein RDMS_12400 [Deinococcus sp. RL]|uniref:WD40 repeat domain-containing protein n=1 Tax=Deinococcus sp. RL TaxID=1489678 RepID=UPI0004D71CC3|nr:hypothetical protein [Deinococcus sp. RL]KEF33473.1 hypothetical protein RDMS_12400 [Deinococcus sp. RL]